MKNKNKGFTLIELLAIIVILAIIAVITIPILLNVIENSRKGAAQDSAYGFKDSINKWYVSKLSSDRQLQLEGEYTVSNGVLKGDNIEDTNVPVLGTIPSSGTLTYSNNILTSGCLVIGEYAVTFADGTVSKTEKNGECKTVPTIESCPGCVFAWYPSSETKWIKGSGYGENEADGNNKLTDYYEDYSKLIEEKGKNYFLGHVIDDNNYIIKSYACGIENGKAFCLQSSSDGYSSNVDILNSIFPSCNAPTSSSGSSCAGFTVRASAGSNGFVSVYSGSSNCGVGNVGSSNCN